MAVKSQLPYSRINTIMKSSSDVDNVSRESSILMAKAAEMFLRNLALEGYNTTGNGKKLDYKHLAEVVHSDEKYNFLRDIMPKKITVLEAKKLISKKQALENGKDSQSSSDEESSSGSDESSSESERSSEK